MCSFLSLLCILQTQRCMSLNKQTKCAEAFEVGAFGRTQQECWWSPWKWLRWERPERWLDHTGLYSYAGNFILGETPSNGVNGSNFCTQRTALTSYTQDELFKGEPMWVAHGAEAPAIAQATVWTPATEVGGAGNTASSFSGALLMGNGVETNLGIGLWEADRGCHLLRRGRRQNE